MTAEERRDYTFLIDRLKPHVALEGKGYLDMMVHKLGLAAPRRRNRASETLPAVASEESR